MTDFSPEDLLALLLMDDAPFVITQLLNYPRDRSVASLLVNSLERTKNVQLWEHILTTDYPITIEEKEQLFLAACRSGNADLAMWMTDKHRNHHGVSPRCCNDVAIVWACLSDNYTLLRWLLTSPSAIENIPFDAHNHYVEQWCEQYNKIEWYLTLQSQLSSMPYEEGVLFGC